MPRKLHTIGQWINDHLASHGFRAEVTRNRCGREGAAVQRDGNRLVVYRNSELLLDHDAAATYRGNADVEQWLQSQLVSLQIQPRHLAA
ncbi:hypothetical protein [Cupriavidus malaysiensis]|uniref:Uncharacterized protein n=1 Tax=Cupriavidus malaysiensis TaxID=367825 RepID=A0ABM6FGX3_9BURK|nr:hypothetical protein [Cupriavidus malaysiensis]AOZ11167.1 hypothetical protein BKK80_35025 [Cupriavidus malaysiensis]